LAINRPDKDDANVPHTYARSKRKARLSDHSSHLLHSDSVESEEGLVAPDFDDESGADVDSETAFFIDIDDFAAPAITAFHKCCKT
jgi:hypothetical protein